MPIYQKLNSYIDSKGLDKISISERARIPISTLNAIFSGKRTLYADDLKAICYALEVKPETFIDYKPA